MTALHRSDSEFDKFLFEVVFESDELPITVMSMLTRLGLDPWIEASRLSRLPKPEAIASLAQSIRKLISRPIAVSDANEIAARLTDRLPSHEDLVAQATRHETIDLTTMWLIISIFLMMMTITQTHPPDAGTDDTVHAQSAQVSPEPPHARKY